MPLIKCKTCGALFPQATPNSKCSICGGELTGIISSKKAPITSTPFSQKPSIKSDKIPTFGTESLRAGYFNSSNGRYEEKMTLPASAFSTKLTHNKERIQTETPVVQIPQPIPKVKDEQIPKVIDKQPVVANNEAVDSSPVNQSNNVMDTMQEINNFYDRFNNIG